MVFNNADIRVLHQAVQTNRGDAIIVAQRIGELMMVMIEAYAGKAEDDMDSSFKTNLVRFGQYVSVFDAPFLCLFTLRAPEIWR